MGSVMQFLTKTRLGVALIVAAALGSVIITQYLSIKSYESRLSEKTEDAAACKVAKSVADSEIKSLTGQIGKIREQLESAEAKARAAEVIARSSASKEIRESEERAAVEADQDKTAEEMGKWYESVW